jgi:hypothetical protein
LKNGFLQGIAEIIWLGRRFLAGLGRWLLTKLRRWFLSRLGWRLPTRLRKREKKNEWTRKTMMLIADPSAWISACRCKSISQDFNLGSVCNQLEY